MKIAIVSIKVVTWVRIIEFKEFFQRSAEMELNNENFTRLSD